MKGLWKKRGLWWKFAPLIYRFCWGLIVVEVTWSLAFIIIIFLAAPRGLRDFSSWARDRTRAPCNGSTET